MISVFLCDDNKLILDQYEALVKNLAEKNHVQVKISRFTSGEQLLFSLEEKPNSANIIYLDILMGKTNGIETAKKIRQLGSAAEIIFLTSSEEYVFEAFDASPLHYLLKNEVTTERFEELFLKAVDLCKQKEGDYFICTMDGVTKQIPLTSISHFEINNRIVTVYYDQESFDFYSSMEKLQKELEGKGFERIQRSFIINLRFIDSIQRNTIVLITGEQLPIGTTYLKSLKTSFSEYLAHGI